MEVVQDALQCTHVVNCTLHHPCVCEKDGVQYLRVPIVDEVDQAPRTCLRRHLTPPPTAQDLLTHLEPYKYRPEPPALDEKAKEYYHLFLGVVHA